MTNASGMKRGGVPRPPTAAVILAGGSGRRLGGVLKARLTVGGERLLDTVAAVLRPCAAPLLVSIGGHSANAFGLAADVIPLPDPPGPAAGPLSGIAAAAHWLAARPSPPALLASVAVDTPLLPGDFVPRLLDALGPEDDVAVAACAGQLYPTNALWRLEALVRLLGANAATVTAGGPKGLIARMRARVVAWPDGPDGDPFASVNTPDDLQALALRAARQRGVHDGPHGLANGVGKAGQTR